MSRFQIAFSNSDDPAAISSELCDGLNASKDPSINRVENGGMGVLYATDVIGDQFQNIVNALKLSTGIDTWVGTLGVGVLANERAAFDRPAAVAMILDVPSSDYRMLPISPIPGSLPEDIQQWTETVRPTSGLVHADPSSPTIATMIEGIAERTGAYLVGGLTCSRGPQHQLAGDVGNGGLSGALFSPDIAVTAGLSQGCSPLGPTRQITSGESNIVYELDGRPAIDVFKEDIGEMLARDLERAAGYVHVAFPVSGADTADYMVRDLMGIDPESGWLGVGSEITVGDRVMFVRRDPMSAQKDLGRMLRDVKKRLPGPARGAIYVSCVARGPSMFGDEETEAEIVSDGLGGTPVIGFYASGEICHDRIYGYTGVLLVFG